MVELVVNNFWRIRDSTQRVAALELMFHFRSHVVVVHRPFHFGLTTV